MEEPGLEERTDRLLRRSSALLRRGSRSRALPAPTPDPSPPTPDLSPTGDPLFRWRLRRRAEEPSWGPPSWTPRDRWEAAGPLQRALSSLSRDAEEASRPMNDSSHDAPRRLRWRSGDPCRATQPIRKSSQELLRGQPCWMSRDPCGASECCPHDWRCSHKPLLQEPPSRSHDPHEPPQPIRRGSQGLPWGQPCWTSHESMEPPKPEEGISHEPLQQVPCDPCEALQPIRSCTQDALRQGSPLEDRNALRQEPSLRSCDPHEALRPISSSSQDALQPLKDDSHASSVDPILRLLRRRRRLLWQGLRAVDAALATLPHQSH